MNERSKLLNLRDTVLSLPEPAPATFVASLAGRAAATSGKAAGARIKN
jgi:hypothetical protein